jgi:hypothetical protein
VPINTIPTLNQRGNAGRGECYARGNKYLAGIFAGAFDGRCSLVDIFDFGFARIGCQPVGVDRRAWLDVLPDKHLICFGFCVGNNLLAAVPEVLGGEQFHGDRHQHLAVLAMSYTTEGSFINFDVFDRPASPKR